MHTIVLTNIIPIKPYETICRYNAHDNYLIR